MKPSLRNTTLVLGALAGISLTSAFAQNNARPSPVIIITPPAVNDGSVHSRAPFPSSRQFDDVKAPDGHAIDVLPPNTDSTTPQDIVPPAPKLAIFQSRPSTPFDPGLLPTGRATVSVSAALDAPHFAPNMRSADFAMHDQIVADAENRLRASSSALNAVRRTKSEMSAEGRALFDAAANDADAKEKALRQSIRTARHANSSNWDAARAQLAADYEAYADTTARIDTAAGITPVR